MGPPIDHTGAKIGVPKGGHFRLLKISQNRGYPQWYISTPAWRSDLPFHMQSNGSPTGTHMYLALRDLYGSRRGDDPSWVHECQNGKISRLGRPSWVGSVGDLVAPSLDSRPLISPLVPCLGTWLAVTLAAYCSPRGWSHGWSRKQRAVQRGGTWISAKSDYLRMSRRSKYETQWHSTLGHMPQ